MAVPRGAIRLVVTANAGIAWVLVGLFAIAGTPNRAEKLPDAEPVAHPIERVLSSEQLAAWIDERLAESWREAHITPAPMADDAEFLRRAHLDLVGKIPSVSEVRAFLADSTPDKRRQLVESLVSRGAYASHFANTWRGWLLAGAVDGDEVRGLVPQLEDWLRLRFVVNTPYDQMVRDILTAPLPNQMPATAQGRGKRYGPPNLLAFYAANERKPELMTASTTRAFLGVQVQCAQCHDHPFSHWTRKEFWALAVFFNELDPAVQKSGDVSAHRSTRIPDSDVVVEAAFLDGAPVDWQSGDSQRALLARWVTRPDNPYFARAMANRLWDHFLGHGFVTPVDDLDPANPPSHPELLDEIARQFILHHWDLKYLVRAITATHAYQLSSRTGVNESDDVLLQFARMPVRRMTADQLFDSLVEATGYREPRRETRVDVFSEQSTARAEFRRKFADQSGSRSDAETTILQALSLMNGQFVADVTGVTKSETLTSVAEAPFLDANGRIETLFLATLSRPPEPSEMAAMIQHVKLAGPAGQRAALGDVLWTLLNSTEFVLNH